VLSFGFDQRPQDLGKKMSDIKVVVNGVGAAGVACTKIIMAAGVKSVIGLRSAGRHITLARAEHMNRSKTGTRAIPIPMVSGEPFTM